MKTRFVTVFITLTALAAAMAPLAEAGNRYG